MSFGTLFLIWLSSFIISHSILFGTVFQLIKILGENDYILDLDNLESFHNLLSKNNDNKNNDMIFSITRVIPIINIVFACNLYMQFNNQKDTFFTELDTFDCIREMTDEEKKEYDKDKSISFLIKAMRREKKDEKEINEDDLSKEIDNFINNNQEVDKKNDIVENKIITDISDEDLNVNNNIDKPKVMVKKKNKKQK